MTSPAATLLWTAGLGGLFALFARPAKKLLGPASDGAVLPLALLLWAWVHWILGSLIGLPQGAPGAWLSLSAAALLVFGAARAVRFRKPEKPDWNGLWMACAVFAGALAVRAFSPGMALAERLPDMAVFQAARNAVSFPPEDLWLSGHTLNYYYFGQLLFAPLTNLTRVPPELAFNLSTCTIAALTSWITFSLVRMARGSRGAALFAAAASVLLSNWYWMWQVSRPGAAGLYWWDSSRAIFNTAGSPNTITEFPYFSFLLGDFHAHFIALPWLGLSAALLWPLARALEEGERARAWTLSTLAALSVGVHYALNPWEIPFVALLAVLFLWRHPKHLVAIGAGALLLFLPFWLHYERPVSSFGWVPLEYRSPLHLFLLHWGLFLAPLFVLALRDVRNVPRKEWMNVAVVTISLGLFGGWAVAVLALLASVLFSEGHLKISEFSGKLLGVGFLALALSEVIHVDNLYGPELRRMNTVFKFYMVGWWALAIGVPLLLDRALDGRLFRGSLRVRAMVGLIALSLVYPLGATSSRLDRGPWVPSLDGMADWDQAAPGEREAVNWLRENTGERDVLWEETGPAYQRFARFATFAGRPTVLGWNNHEWVWRKNGHALVEPREKEMEALKKDPTDALLREFFRKYDVKWVTVGSLERKTYTPALLTALEKLPVAFQNNTTKIYGARLP